MIRKTLIATSVLAVLAAAPVQAADCAASYKDFWEKISGDAKNVGGINISTIAAINRTAIRAFDACQSGDEGNFGAGFWEKMALYGEAKDNKKFWEELSLYGEAK